MSRPNSDPHRPSHVAPVDSWWTRLQAPDERPLWFERARHAALRMNEVKISYNKPHRNTRQQTRAEA